MVVYGGFMYGMKSEVNLCTLDLEYEDPDDKQTSRLSNITFNVTQLKNKRGENAELKERDRLFYNQVTYLQKPISSMVGVSRKLFDKSRYICVVGRRALHVFDIEEMDFIIADIEKGYELRC